MRRPTKLLERRVLFVGPIHNSTSYRLHCVKHQSFCALILLASAVVSLSAESFPVEIHVDAAQTKGELKPIWRFFGADEPNYAYMKNGQKLLAELGKPRPEKRLSFALTIC